MILTDSTLTPVVTRYYEKSIIEQAINQERSSRAAYWEETKKSIREARYRLSLSNNSDLAGTEVGKEGDLGGLWGEG